MMSTKKRPSYLTILQNFAAIASLAIPGCAVAPDATTVSPSSPQTAQLIHELDAARQTDRNASRDPSVSLARRATFLNQMNKAVRASDELSQGIAVPQNKIDDALWSPPRHLSPVWRAQLIQELEAARQQDEQNEQYMLNWASAGVLDTGKFDTREQEVDAVIRNLETGAPVQWYEVRQALVVEQDPY